MKNSILRSQAENFIQDLLWEKKIKNTNDEIVDVFRMKVCWWFVLDECVSTVCLVSVLLFWMSFLQAVLSLIDEEFKYRMQSVYEMYEFEKAKQWQPDEERFCRFIFIGEYDFVFHIWSCICFHFTKLKKRILNVFQEEILMRNYWEVIYWALPDMGTSGRILKGIHAKASKISCPQFKVIIKSIGRIWNTIFIMEVLFNTQGLRCLYWS